LEPIDEHGLDKHILARGGDGAPRRENDSGRKVDE
jgi:hypothetical protein